MSFRIGEGGREEGDEELFGTSSAVSGGARDSHRLFVAQPLRRMNSDNIYDMSSMTAHLPAKKKGLSRYYEGRSQSFACMSEVQNLEDLQKDNPYKQKIKAWKSYAALLGMAQAKQSCANLNIVAADGFRAKPIHVNKNGCHQ